MSTVSREELKRRLPNATTSMLDKLEGKTESEVVEFIDNAMLLQSLPDDVFRQVQAIIALFRGHPLQGAVLMRRLERGQATIEQVAAEALKWLEGTREGAP